MFGRILCQPQPGPEPMQCATFTSTRNHTKLTYPMNGLFRITTVGLAALALAQHPCAEGADVSADPAIATAIAQIRAFDNHAHPLRITAEGEEDSDWDALVSQEPLPEFPLPVGLRPDNPRNIAAWRDLYGYPHDDLSKAHVAELIESKRRIRREKAEAYPAWVLDRLGIETMVANRTAMGKGIDRPRFCWAAFADELLFPFTNHLARAKNPEYRSYYAGLDSLLAGYLKERGLSKLPASLDGYLANVVTPTLERFKADSAIALKVEAAYLRSLNFADVPAEEAKRVYRRHVKGSVPSPADYKALQDWLFRFIAREAGRLGLAVHLHTGAGAGSYFDLTGSNPAQLESALNDPALRGTRFVLIHGGWPFHQQTAFLLAKPNVYADFSAMTFLLSARSLAGVLRTWLEWYPEKILFGTDGFAITPELGWEEVAWLSNRTGREALALALTGLVNDGEISRERALELARRVMRDNALQLYHLP